MPKRSAFTNINLAFEERGSHRTYMCVSEHVHNLRHVMYGMGVLRIQMNDIQTKWGMTGAGF